MVTPLEWSRPLALAPREGRLVSLEPLAAGHEPELLSIAQQSEIWRFTTHEAESTASMRDYVERALGEYEAGLAAPFVVRMRESGRLAGFTRLKNLSRENRTAGVGSWFAPEAWGTGANAESKLLLLEFAFDHLRCIRVEFQTDSRNVRSRRALAALGAAEEGILRSRAITRDGVRRDSVVFSITDDEWPIIKRQLAARIDNKIAGKTGKIADNPTMMKF